MPELSKNKPSFRVDSGSDFFPPFDLCCIPYSRRIRPLRSNHRLVTRIGVEKHHLPLLGNEGPLSDDQTCRRSLFVIFSLDAMV